MIFTELLITCTLSINVKIKKMYCQIVLVTRVPYLLAKKVTHLEYEDITLGTVMTHPSVLDIKCVKYYSNQTWQKVMAQARIMAICAMRPWPLRCDCGSRSWTTTVWNIRTQLDSKKLWPRHWFSQCVYCDLVLKRYDCGPRSWHSFGLWTTILWNIIQIQHNSSDLRPGQELWLRMQCDLGDMTLGPDHDTSLDHGQQLREILYRSNITVGSYCPNNKYSYACSVTLTLEIWPRVQVMTHF